MLEILQVVVEMAYVIYMLYTIFQVIKKKELKRLILLCFTLPFTIFWWSMVLLGGSAYNDAAIKYDLYQEGHYYLFSHGIYTEVTKEQYTYMRIIEIVSTVCFFIGMICSLIDGIGNRFSKGINYSSKTTKNTLQFGENTKKYKKSRRFISCSTFAILRFSLYTVFLFIFSIIIFSNFEWIHLIFIAMLIYLLIGNICQNFSTCLFKRDKLIVRSDSLFKIHQVQKRCVIHYADIKDINIINVRFKNTQGGDILLNERDRTLRNRRGIIKEKPSYYEKYRSLDLEIIYIDVKNGSHPEGIVLNLYTHQQKECIFNELKRRIQESN